MSLHLSEPLPKAVWGEFGSEYFESCDTDRIVLEAADLLEFLRAENEALKTKLWPEYCQDMAEYSCPRVLQLQQEIDHLREATKMAGKDTNVPTSTEGGGVMKRYHVATGDGNAYYGVDMDSYLEATELLKISQSYDPKAYIVEEDYYFTNGDKIRTMTDRELAEFIHTISECTTCLVDNCDWANRKCVEKIMQILQQPYDKEAGFL